MKNASKLAKPALFLMVIIGCIICSHQMVIAQNNAEPTAKSEGDRYSALAGELNNESVLKREAAQTELLGTGRKFIDQYRQDRISKQGLAALAELKRLAEALKTGVTKPDSQTKKPAEQICRQLYLYALPRIACVASGLGNVPNRSGDNMPEVFIMNSDGSAPQPITYGGVGDLVICWSPDGARIAFCSEREGNAEVYSIRVDGQDPQNLSKNSSSDMMPDWSPDGKKIVFVSNRDQGVYHICMMDADGQHQHAVGKKAIEGMMPKWSPDGQQIAYIAGDPDSCQLIVMDADGNHRQQLTARPIQCDALAWSPDGTRIAFIRKTAVESEHPVTPTANSGNLYIMDVAKTTESALTNDDTAKASPNWSADGRQIMFGMLKSGSYQICIVNVDTKNVEPLINQPGQKASQPPAANSAQPGARSGGYAGIFCPRWSPQATPEIANLFITK